MPSSPESYYRRPLNIKTRTGAGGVVARRDGDQVFISLIRDRGDHEWALPKGGVEKRESLEQAAAREIEEEAGFSRLKLLVPLGVGERLSGKRTTWQTTTYFLFLTDQLKGTPSDPRDWEVGWFNLLELPDLYWREQHAILHGNCDKIRALVFAADRT